jgi:hypothetical protein
MKKIFLIIISFIAIIIIGLFFLFNQKTINNFTRKNNFKINLARNFSINKYTENNLEAKADNGDILKITVLNIKPTEKIDEILKVQKRQFLSQYESQLPPYPEFLNVENSCGEKFLPKEKQTKYGSYYTTFAGRGLGYGICVEDMITHEVGLGFFGCLGNQFIKMEYFISKNSEVTKIDDVLNSFECL